MQRRLRWLLRANILGNFLTGLFFILPAVLTVVIIGWVIGQLDGILGPSTWLGGLLSVGGSTIVGPNHQAVSFALGLLLAMVGLWALGVVVRTRARKWLDAALAGLLDRMPVVRLIYGPVSQVVNLLRSDKSDAVKRMSVVLCRFGSGDAGSVSVLAFLTGRTVYRIGERPSYLVYLPTSPLPMSGGLTFVATESVTPVPELDVDGLMRIYFSLGALGQQVMPDRLKAGG